MPHGQFVIPSSSSSSSSSCPSSSSIIIGIRERHSLSSPATLVSFPRRSGAAAVTTRAAFVPAADPPQSDGSYPSPGDSVDGKGTGAEKGKSSTDGNRPAARKGWRLWSNEKWGKKQESALRADQPLPLPMTFPTSPPLSPEKIQKMTSCNPDKEDCKTPIYQWSGECQRCQGTGEVSFYRKRGKEVICKCIACMGIGYVQKITIRNDIDTMENLDGKA